MKHLLILFVILIVSITSTDAKNIEGRVLNDESLPLQNVAVYLKDDPFLRSFTDENGEFMISLEDIKHKDEHKLVFSHIGYKTKEYLLKDMKESVYHEITLLENTIILGDANVIVRQKLSRKERKDRKISIIEQFQKRLKKDFIIEDRTYKIESKVEVIREAEIVFYNKLIAEHKELSGVKPDKTDSISSTYTDIENYMDNDFEQGIKKMSDKFIDNNVVSKKRKENKRMLDSTFYKTILTDSAILKEMFTIHKSFWQLNRQSEKHLPKLDMNPKKWEVIEGSEQTILRYKEKRGILGIVKNLMVSNFIIDPYNYSLERSFIEFSVEVNIPFGYKLPPDALMLLNIINVNNHEMKKYRLRHFHLDGTLNTIYKKTEATKYGDESGFDLNFSLTDTKKRNIKVESKAFVKVLSIE